MNHFPPAHPPYTANQPSMQNVTRIILIEPRDPRNVGMVARAMANFGFSDLALVAPPEWDAEQARVTARNASDIIDNVRICATLQDAAADTQTLCGFALRENIPATRMCDLIQVASHRRNAQDVRFSLIYGPETDDLRHEHLDLCRWVVRIPTHSAYPSFNLAQSVLVTLYELTRGAEELTQSGDARGAELPSAGELDQLDRILSDVMAQSGFTRHGMPPAAARRIHALLRRADLDQSEVAALMALFGKVRTSLARAATDESTG